MTAPSNIRVLALDVDGVLTDGKLSMDTSGSKTKIFHVHDGLGISLWQKAGFHTIIISGRNEPCVEIRADELKIEHVKQGSKNKIADLEEVLREIQCEPNETCFIGDDLGDLAVMKSVGYSIAVKNAVKEIKSNADWVTSKSGGNGAVREAIEHLMNGNNTWNQSVSSMLTEHANQ
ncbi:MAG: HAD hydrolase family protein [Phycisphaerales bacterium]|jgi:3-deoxy-D-manno-octulosonate 8-phosphate phosphatase (KDO 8-P phosphatase)|nr:HAD hydrolase family protein [Phycisphaerales bacterium]